MRNASFYTVQEALARESDDTRPRSVNESTETAQEIVESMTISQAREAMALADAIVRSAEENKKNAIAAKQFIKDQLFREVE